MIDMDVVTLSRIQFGLTASYHFLFVPLTLGLSVLMAMMESIYVMTGRDIWRQATRFWGKLFGINFAMGIATGITLEFQFGTNWAYYSHFVGDIFGVPLALEGLMAFFLESTFVGLFFFGWGRLSRLGHLAVTWLVAIGSNLSALWILVANGWMNNPVGAEFNVDTMRMELTSMWQVFFNPAAQSKFVHTVSAGYVTGAIFVLSISAWYMLKGRHTAFARRSMIVAASFGLASALSVVVLGDERGYTASEHQKMKIAAMEAMWETEDAPAGFTVFGWPDQKKQVTRWVVRVPYVLGIIATRSFDEKMPGIRDLVERAERRIRDGLTAYAALQRLRKDRSDAEARATLLAHQGNLGHALLLRRYLDDPTKATEAQIKQAALDTVPSVLPLFWAFRIMVLIGFLQIALFAWAFYECSRRRFGGRWFRRVCFYSLPLPWIAAELGWFVAEHGRQPWTVEAVLPTFLSASNIPASNVILSLAGFVVFYSALAIVDVWLMTKYVRKGPVEALGLEPEPSAAYARAAGPRPGE